MKRTATLIRKGLLRASFHSSGDLVQGRRERTGTIRVFGGEGEREIISSTKGGKRGSLTKGREKTRVYFYDRTRGRDGGTRSKTKEGRGTCHQSEERKKETTKTSEGVPKRGGAPKPGKTQNKRRATVPTGEGGFRWEGGRFDAKKKGLQPSTASQKKKNSHRK